MLVAGLIGASGWAGAADQYWDGA
ncbi:MAG: hypothetical protein JWP52_2838, partial [Rhizobacter sp.]|nr:hypothetical protein [Rhizobacter sp.]